MTVGKLPGTLRRSGCLNYAACGHAYILIPDGDCDDDCEGRIVRSQSSIAASRNDAWLARNPVAMKQDSQPLISPVERFRSQMRQRYHLPGQPAAPRD